MNFQLPLLQGDAQRLKERYLSFEKSGVSPNVGFKSQLERWGTSEKLQQLRCGLCSALLCSLADNVLALRDTFRAEREANESLKKLHQQDLQCLEERKKASSSELQ